MSLTNMQYETIMREYDKKQLDNRNKYDVKIKKLYHDIPELKVIEDKIISTLISTKKAEILNQTQLLNSLNSAYEQLLREKLALLKIHNIPKDFFEQIYYCKDCKDTGFINNQKCHCFKQSIVDLLYNQSNIKNALQYENFSTFHYDYFDNSDDIHSPYKNIISIVNHCKSYIHNFDNHYENFLFLGATGVGKTFLTNCIAKELLDRYKTVIYLTAYELFELFSSYTFDKKHIDNDYINHIFNCDLLIIDDLGTEMINSFTTTQLFNTINERHLTKKSTIISTNLSVQSLFNIYSERIASRLTSYYKLFKITGDDIRHKKKTKHS